MNTHRAPAAANHCRAGKFLADHCSGLHVSAQKHTIWIKIIKTNLESKQDYQSENLVNRCKLAKGIKNKLSVYPLCRSWRVFPCVSWTEMASPRSFLEKPTLVSRSRRSLFVGGGICQDRAIIPKPRALENWWGPQHGPAQSPAEPSTWAHSRQQKWPWQIQLRPWNPMEFTNGFQWKSPMGSNGLAEVMALWWISPISSQSSNSCKSLLTAALQWSWCSHFVRLPVLIHLMGLSHGGDGTIQGAHGPMPTCKYTWKLYQ